MKLNTIYYSPTQTTKKVVESITSPIGRVEASYDITLLKNRQSSLSFNENDLLVIGVPVYGGRIPLMIETFLSNLKGHQTPVVIVAVYGNRHYDDTLIEMKTRLSNQGFMPIAAAAFIGEHSYNANVATNRPDSDDLDKCQSFGKEVLAILKSGAYHNLTLEVKGNFPFKDRPSPDPVGPTVYDTCIKCGACVNNCPVEALTLDGKIIVDENKCIRCHACVRVCPKQAIQFDSRIDHIKTWLENSFSERREPETFLPIKS